MIDYIKMTADNLPDDYADTLIETSEYEFNTKRNKAQMVLNHDTRKGGLYLKLSRTRTGWKLKISGSLKNYRNGENASPMDFAQTTEAIYALAASVYLDPSQFSVTKLEASVPVLTAPIDKLVDRYSQLEFMPMLVPTAKSGFGGKSYGVIATSPYPYIGIKIYRKNEEQQIHHGRKVPHFQQVEFCIDKACFLRDKLKRAGIASDSPLKGGVVLSDLTKPEVQHILCDLLADIPNQITLKNDAMAPIDYDAILLTEAGMKEKKLLDLLAFAESRSYRERLKVKSRTRYYELQKDFTRLRSQLCPPSDKELRKFRQALQAAVEAGRPTEAYHIISMGKQSRKKTKTSTLTIE